MIGTIRVRNVGFMAYPDTPDGWSSLAHMVSRVPVDLACGTPMDLITFTHPAGCQSTAYCPSLGHELWCPFTELDVVVRFGTDSDEHRTFLQGQSR